MQALISEVWVNVVVVSNEVLNMTLVVLWCARIHRNNARTQGSATQSSTGIWVLLWARPQTVPVPTCGWMTPSQPSLYVCDMCVCPIVSSLHQGPHISQGTAIKLPQCRLSTTMAQHARVFDAKHADFDVDSARIQARLDMMICLHCTFVN